MKRQQRYSRASCDVQIKYETMFIIGACVASAAKLQPVDALCWVTSDGRLASGLKISIGIPTYQGTVVIQEDAI